jgi:hypothetical protein
MDKLKTSPQGRAQVRQEFTSWVSRLGKSGVSIVMLEGTTTAHKAPGPRGKINEREETWIDALVNVNEAKERPYKKGISLDLVKWLATDNVGRKIRCQRCDAPLRLDAVEPPPGATNAWALRCADLKCSRPRKGGLRILPRP